MSEGQGYHPQWTGKPEGQNPPRGGSHVMRLIPTEAHRKMIERMIKLQDAINAQRGFILYATPLPEAVQ